MCMIVGCPDVEEFDGTQLVFIGAGSDPYEVITNAVKLVSQYLFYLFNSSFVLVSMICQI